MLTIAKRGHKIVFTVAIHSYYSLSLVGAPNASSYSKIFYIPFCLLI